MAAKGTFPIKVESNLHGFAVVLKSAVCEWLLLFLLLLDAAFSYLLTKFAQYCGLQLPCILCSRLDHVLGNEKPDFYKNLLCSNHRSELSSLVLCHNHGKIADAHEMCEQCVLSFIKKESNQEMIKVLVGKLGSDCLQKPFLSMDGSLSTRLCSCCNKPWRSRPNVHKLLQSRPSGPVSKPDIPLPKSPGRRCLNRQEGLKKRKDRFSVSTTPILLGRAGYDSLSHVGYTEVKISSDSESDFPFSDDDDNMMTVPPEHRHFRDEFITQQGFKSLHKRQYDDFSPAGLLHKSNHAMNNLMHQEPESDKDEATTPKYMVSNGDARNSFTETNWQQIRRKASPPLPEFTSLEDIPLSTSVPEISPVVSPDEGDKVPLSKKLGASGLSDVVFHNTTPLSKSMQLPVGMSKEKWMDGKENGEIGHTSAANNWESIDLNSTTTLKDIGIDPLRKDVASLPISGSEAEDIVPSIRKDVKLSEQIGGRDCCDIDSNEEPTTSTASLVPLADPSLRNKNPTVNGQANGLHMADASGSTESLMPSESSKTERACHEPLRGNTGETEGENLVDKLRQQVEYNQKCVENLYKELEEERNAAAIAANQAMAMITKLQEEKAALNMEALQYLRMMEEQAEYDMEALEKANDLLAEKEKEIQDLEAELDYFRIKYPEDFPEDLEMHGEDLDKADTLTFNMETIHFEES